MKNIVLLGIVILISSAITDLAARKGTMLPPTDSPLGLESEEGDAAREKAAHGFDYPVPTGEFPVGTRYMLLEDPARPDRYSNDPDDKRWVSIKVWYPAIPLPGSRREPYGVDGEGIRGLVKAGIFDSLIIDEVNLKPSASYLEAPVYMGNAPWPVLIYSSSGVMTANIFLCEELASHGYIVLAIGHPYWCEFYFDEEGGRFHFDKSNEFYVQMWQEEESPEVIKTKEAITRSKDSGERMNLYRKLNELMPTEVSDLALWQEDIDFLLRKLEELSSTQGPFKGMLDTSRIGIFGYSKGGALSGQFCATDDRIRAGINLGGFVFGGLVENDLRNPFMTIEHVEPWCADCPALGLPFFERSNHDTYIIQIVGGTHATFTDLPLLAKYIIQEGIIGPLDGRQSARIVNSYVLAFFDRYVKGVFGLSVLNDVPSRFPEVRFLRKTR